MNYRDYIVFDFETTSANPLATQPVQIAAVAVHGRKLEIKEGSEFQSLIKPIFDEAECDRLGVDSLQDGAVAKHGKTKEMLEEAPTIQSVWPNFVEYVNQYNYRGGNFTAPIAVGYNIRGFDMKIVDRICGSDPYNLGPTNKGGGQDLFNKIHIIDLMDLMFIFFESNKDVNSLSADNLIRGYFGYDKGQAHDAMSDVIMTAELFCRSMKMMRGISSRKKFKGSMVSC